MGVCGGASSSLPPGGGCFPARQAKRWRSGRCCACRNARAVGRRPTRLVAVQPRLVPPTSAASLPLVLHCCMPQPADLREEHVASNPERVIPGGW